ncbi:hypothetical protein ACFQU2_01595 [Siccirubricoccus deserti]
MEAPGLLLLALTGLTLVVAAGEGPVGRIGVGLCAWGSIGAALGYAGRHPPAASPTLGWLGEATMPVYVLHHIPVLALGVLVLPWGWGPLATVLVIWPLATVISLLAYRLLVQPFPGRAGWWAWMRGRSRSWRDAARLTAGRVRAGNAPKRRMRCPYCTGRMA